MDTLPRRALRRSVLLLGPLLLLGAAPAEGFDLHRVFRWLRDQAPLAEINQRHVLPTPHVKDRRIGESGSFPLALKIVVDKDSTGFPAGIGKIVHEALFPNYPGFTFKVLFASAKRDLFGKSQYANPKSIWYNVFFGYYEIVVSKRAWGRPFGYDLSSGTPRVHFEDLVRIGKADWNHFSNQLYGVPAAAIRPYDRVDLKEVRIAPVRRELIGPSYWDLIELSGVRVVGPYRSRYDGGRFQDLDRLVGLAWRLAFGTYDGNHRSIRRSFAGTSMRGKFYISFKEENDRGTGEPVYKTYMYGGTVNEGYPDGAENERFLELQMRSLRRILAGERGLGFPK
jgi:hypothetical protein